MLNMYRQNCRKTEIRKVKKIENIQKKQRKIKEFYIIKLYYKVFYKIKILGFKKFHMYTLHLRNFRILST